MPRSVAFALPIWLLACLGSSATAATQERPNVLLIFADDQGSIDLNCYGARDLHTPNLDGLATRGVRFTQFYVAAPVCSPSRAALLTGRYPQRAGVPGNVPSHPGQKGMPTEQLTMAEVFREAGYRTGCIGKWHLGTDPECAPNGQGFDEFFGFKAGCIDNWSHFFYWVPPHFHDLHRNGKEIYEDGQHFTSLIAREANRFIRESKDRPFFLYTAINIPHYPLQPYAKYREMFAAKKDMPWERQEYAAWVATMDDCVGEILATLDELKLREKTLVVWLPDHGHSTESRANFGGGNAGPYRGWKFTLWEGGIRVPCIVSWPGHVPQGEVRGQMAVSVDWLPTFCDFCGIELPRRKLDGTSIRPVIESAEAPSPHEVFHWQMGNMWAVRRGDWKLVAERQKKSPKVSLLLSNLAEDVTETKSLGDENPEVVRELSELHEAWTKEVEQQ